MSGLGAVNRTTLREQVLAQLRESILDGTLPPGTKMAEVDLAGVAIPGLPGSLTITATFQSPLDTFRGR